MLDLSWTRTLPTGACSWQIHITDTKVNVVRFPTGPAGTIREYPSDLSPKQLDDLHAVLAHYGVHAFPDRCFCIADTGKLSWRAPGTPREIEFGAFPDASDDARWLRFPVGAVDTVARMVEDLRSAVYGATTRSASYWRLPSRQGPAAGSEQSLDQRPRLSYLITEPNAVDGRERYRCTTWYCSGRVTQETLLVGEQSTSRTLRWERRLDPATVASQARMFWDKKFFDASSQGRGSGSSYDGEEIITYTYCGSQMTKVLSYEVEMGARCGLSAVENWGIDWIRQMERNAERKV